MKLVRNVVLRDHFKRVFGARDYFYKRVRADANDRDLVCTNNLFMYCVDVEIKLIRMTSCVIGYV